MACRDAPVVALAHRLHGQVLQRTAHGIVRVVNQHVDVLVVLLGELKTPIDMCSCVLVEHLEPGQATYDTGAHAHRLLHQEVSPRVSNESFLWKSDYLDMDNVAPAFPQCQEAFEGP